MSHPVLVVASSLKPGEIGEWKWERKSENLLTFSDNDLEVQWTTPASLSWIPIKTKALLHSGKFTWDFVVEEMGSAQIGIGIMLDWSAGPDWGFFGYLGASSTAWSYDPSTGDIVTSSDSIHGGLPKFTNNQGTVSVEAILPRDGPGSFTFIVNGIRTPTISHLPVGSVIVPAACLLKHNQKVKLANFHREDIK